MTFNKPEFLACSDCGIVQFLSCPSLHQLEDDVETAAPEVLDEFIACHQSHRTAPLYRCGCECRADRPLWDPMATVTFTATDGERTYLVTGTRPSIDAPRVYRFEPGTLTLQQSDVSIDVADLRLGLDLQFFPHVLPPTKLNRFVEAVQDVIGSLVPEDLEIAFDDVDDPAASIARMPDIAYAQLVDRCTGIFTPWEMELVTKFLQDNRDADGLLALRLQRHFAALPG